MDGLSTKEEELTGVLAEGLGEVPLFGGSAGDGLDFGTTGVLHAGRFASDRAVLALVRTRLPFHVFKTQHFVRGPRRMVVTEADVGARVVKELCGLPAAAAYARALGLERDELTPEVFSTHPVVVRIGGQDYLRSIQSAQPDGSLLFYCAIDEGIIFRVAQGVGLVLNLEQALTAARAAVGDLAGVIGFDCILRRLEIEALSLQGEVDQLVRGHRVVGFSTYGEQFGAMHINQTFTGVAFGHRGAA